MSEIVHKTLEHAKGYEDIVNTIRHRHLRPCLPRGYQYQGIYTCDKCGNDKFDRTVTVGGVAVRSPTTEPMYCDWCDATHDDYRHMGLHVSMCTVDEQKQGFEKTPHKNHPELMQEWLTIHDDGIDFEWREENIPKDDNKSRSPAPIELVYRFGNKIP